MKKKAKDSKRNRKDSSCFSEAVPRVQLPQGSKGVGGGGAGDTALFPTWKKRKHNISWETWSLVRGPIRIFWAERGLSEVEDGVGCALGDGGQGIPLGNEPFPAHCAHSGLRKVRTRRSSEASLRGSMTPALRCMHTPGSAGRQPQSRESTRQRTPLAVV